MNCVLKKIIAHKRLNFIRERDNCDQNAIDLEDRDLQLLINASKLSQKKDELTGNYNFTLVDGAVAVSYMAPFLFRDSLAMHVLTSVPLSSALGKKVVAKELMLWEDDGSGYFSLGGASKRYLALDGALAPPTGADDFNWLRERVLELAAFARSLDRILILPPAWHLARRLAAWELVEVASLEEAGVEWREGSFLANPRLDVDESSTFVRCALDPDGAVVVDGAVLKRVAGKFGTFDFDAGRRPRDGRRARLFGGRDDDAPTYPWRGTPLPRGRRGAGSGCGGSGGLVRGPRPAARACRFASGGPLLGAPPSKGPQRRGPGKTRKRAAFLRLQAPRGARAEEAGRAATPRP